MASLALTQLTLQNWLRPERSGQLAWIVNLLLVIWLAWMLASLSWLILPEPAPENEPAGISAVPAPVQPERPRVDVQEMASWHVFGVADQDQQPVKQVVADAPETRLNLTLRGVFASDHDREGWVIIADPAGKEETYAVNDPVPGGARLAEIYPDRVILERAGSYETLRLPREDLASTTASPNLARTSPGGDDGASQADAFSRYRDEVRQNPGSFMKYARATPARENGEFVGFEIHPGPEAGALQEIGLQPGDIITSINNVLIDSPAKGLQAMRALGEGETVSITLLRGGVETSVSITLPAAQN
jgi:general secretion pathway protein C